MSLPREPARLPLAMLPTPLVRLVRLEQSLGGGCTILLKRDDLTGLELSGNKVRKLEYILAAALRDGAHTIITEGTPQSNHCRATAAACARLGLGCVLLLRPPPSQPVEGNHLLDCLFGARALTFARDDFAARHEQIVAQVVEDESRGGRRARFVPMGASEPLGCWGYITAAAELDRQLAAAGVDECDVLVAVSSGGTLAGLVLGRELLGLTRLQLRGVLVSDDAAWHQREQRRLCAKAIAAFDLPLQADDVPLNLVDGYIGAGYALPLPAAMQAIRDLAACEGVLLDPVYTGKAFAALLDGVRSGALGRDRPVVFIHTGGAFSNFAWGERLLHE